MKKKKLKKKKKTRHDTTGNASIQYKSHRNGRITDDQGGQIGISGGEATCLKEKGHDTKKSVFRVSLT